jgi:bacillithiol biosynthesis deacetylase BshB1
MNASERDPVGLPERVDVLAVGAHPDDVEIACGGTLAKLAQQGFRVGIVDLTDGEPTPLSPGPEVRLREARQAAEVLGVSIRETLPLKNRILMDSFEARVLLARVLRRYRPAVVIGPGGATPMASPDHYQAMLITEAAVFYSRLTKWDDHFEGLPPHRISSLVHYWLALRGPEPPPSAGCFVVDISSTFARKLEAVRVYQTQFPPEKEGVFQAIEAVNRYYGLRAGFEFGELFLMHRLVGTSHFMALALPEGWTARW